MKIILGVLIYIVLVAFFYSLIIVGERYDKEVERDFNKAIGGKSND